MELEEAETELRRYISKKMGTLKDDLLFLIAKQSGDEAENYSHGGNQVFYKESHIGEITFDFSDTENNKITAAFVPRQH